MVYTASKKAASAAFLVKEKRDHEELVALSCSTLLSFCFFARFYMRNLSRAFVSYHAPSENSLPIWGWRRILKIADIKFLCLL
ncbi:hypothetical protein DTO96_102453 [Ephemeroptericola cinctiostellae]|uniref:Uncharacterized protein n=1 Tax=Ephemeroptericola cinctiostellae TaxID=2268024 RepID=A0A345DEA9_9BURK|nr:hypothetical protein [Ephemeroptericola cinctiostellae]AXF86697.1 hypothetical protein DTO96_102453 [Ephemeroptericola cinctiostellae]